MFWIELLERLEDQISTVRADIRALKVTADNVLVGAAHAHLINAEQALGQAVDEDHIIDGKPSPMALINATSSVRKAAENLAIATPNVRLVERLHDIEHGITWASNAIAQDAKEKRDEKKMVVIAERTGKHGLRKPTGRVEFWHPNDVKLEAEPIQFWSGEVINVGVAVHADGTVGLNPRDVSENI